MQGISQNDGVSVFVHDTLQCTNINLDEFCKEQDIEAYVVRINLSSLTVCIEHQWEIFTYRRLHSQFLTQQHN